MNLTNKTIYMMIGLPGSGKSTAVNRLTNLLGNVSTVLSTDAYIEDKAGEKGVTYDEIFEDAIGPATRQMYRDLEHLTEDENTLVVFWDQTNLTKKVRAKKLKSLPKNVNKVAVLCECEAAERKRRVASRIEKFIPEEVLSRMEDSFEEPTLSEGFDSIISLDALMSTFMQINEAAGRIAE